MIFGDEVDQLLDHGKQRALQVVPGAHLVQDHPPSCGQVGLVPVRQPQGGADPMLPFEGPRHLRPAGQSRAWPASPPAKCPLRMTQHQHVHVASPARTRSAIRDSLLPGTR